MGVTLPTRQVGVKVGVKTTDPQPLANQLEGPGGKSVAKYWQERQDSNLRPPVMETGLFYLMGGARRRPLPDAISQVRTD